MSWLKWVSAVIAVFQVVKHLVTEFEVPGNGPQKKQAVLDAVGVMYDTTNEFVAVPLTKQQVLDLASKLIDTVVAFYHLTGVFRHQEKPAA